MSILTLCYDPLRKAMRKLENKNPNKKLRFGVLIALAISRQQTEKNIS